MARRHVAACWWLCKGLFEQGKKEYEGRGWWDSKEGNGERQTCTPADECEPFVSVFFARQAFLLLSAKDPTPNDSIQSKKCYFPPHRRDNSCTASASRAATDVSRKS